jgi:hypothetical protein
MKNLKTLLVGAALAAAVGGAAIAATNAPSPQSVAPSTIPAPDSDGPMMCPSKVSAAPAAQSIRLACEHSKPKESGEADKATAEGDKSGKKEAPTAEADKKPADKPAATA